MPRAGTEDSPASGRAAGFPRSSAPQVPSSHLLGTIHNQESQQASGLGVEGLSWQQGRGRRKGGSSCRWGWSRGGWGRVSDSRCEGGAKDSMCLVCHLCQATTTPGYLATLRSQLEFAGGMVSINSSSSPQAKHPPAPCSLAASSPSSSLQKTKGICPRPGLLFSSKLSTSHQSAPQSQSKPRQSQVALSVPQLTPAHLPPLVSPAWHPAKSCLLPPLLGQSPRRA